MMTRVRRCVSLMIALVLAGTASGMAASRAWATETVDLLLVLAADVSRSVDGKKFQLQREGYAAAVTDQRVLEAIQSGPHSQIAICFVEWSGSDNQKVVIDWTIVRDGASAQQFAAHLVEAPRAFADRTSISGGIDFAMGQFARAPFTSPRRTIDVSGDGTNNSGRDVNLARDEAVAQGVTINGLAILSERPLSWNAEHTNPAGGLEAYFRNNVVGGPGAFVVAAQDFNAFGQAIISKLIAEIAFNDAPRPLRVLPEVTSVTVKSQWLRLFSTSEQSQAGQFGRIPVSATLKRL